MKNESEMKEIKNEVEAIFNKFSASEDKMEINIRNIQGDNKDSRCFVTIKNRKNIVIQPSEYTEIDIGGHNFMRLLKLTEKHKMKLNTIQSHTFTHEFLDEITTSLQSEMLFVEDLE